MMLLKLHKAICLGKSEVIYHLSVSGKIIVRIFINRYLYIRLRICKGKESNLLNDDDKNIKQIDNVEHNGSFRYH